MIIVDLNLLIYAFNRGSERHAQAKAWLEETLSGEELVVVPWQNVVGFTRIVSLPFQRLSRADTVEILQEFFGLFASGLVVVQDPSPTVLKAYPRLVQSTDAYGNLAPDAFLAALAIESGAKLASSDKGFSRFESEGLSWFNPLMTQAVKEKKRRSK
ncbi:MAG: PIN domain-containing protein [Candidatus Doudnabacteria bacterium]|nr:PIN domain-containing protein [Candidatus Doudnabacteria bacterium]